MNRLLTVCMSIFVSVSVWAADLGVSCRLQVQANGAPGVSFSIRESWMTYEMSRDFTHAPSSANPVVISADRPFAMANHFLLRQDQFIEIAIWASREA